ncbi:TNFAIP3-interacting protein 2 isoform X1 [Eucyclogobius newberryi]|uniref:TNFAIP3-interacting protein 2 isoform X1 n=1 Tax=Eucyclogobius newberryi TaxID=166745 RepID=UPI003B5C3207
MDAADAGEVRSYDALNTLYHEARAELERLGTRLRAEETVVSELRARLARYERTYMTVGEKEPVVLGPSMSLLENLCRELRKHTRKEGELEAKAARHAEEVQALTAALRHKELELERARSEPGHEKEREIQGLRSALRQRERSEATRAVLCTSLAEEADQLRGQLGATVRVCKELLARLERGREGDREGDRDSEEKEEKKEEEAQTTNAAETMERLQQENERLKQRVAYVQSLNSQWQKYDSSREEYIRGLCQRVKESSRLVEAPGTVAPAVLHQEIARLNGLLEDKVGECVRLRRDAEDAQRRGRERVQMLEQQVLIYTDDFKSERADRERAQGQIQELKEQIRQLKQQLHKQGAEVREIRDRDRDIVPLCRVHIGHRIAPRRTKDTEHVARSSADRRRQERQEHQQPPQPSGAAAPQRPHWSESAEQSELRCPRCQARFSDAEAAQYFDHWEECARI